jgi:hypothetical protein
MGVAARCAGPTPTSSKFRGASDAIIAGNDAVMNETVDGRMRQRKSSQLSPSTAASGAFYGDWWIVTRQSELYFAITCA